MGVIIVPLFIKASDAKPPAAILIPADCLHITGFHRNDRASNIGNKLYADTGNQYTSSCDSWRTNLSKKLYTTNEIKQYITSCNSWSSNTDKELYTKFLEKHIKTTM